MSRDSTDDHPVSETSAPEDLRPSRRGFLLAGLGLVLAGCQAEKVSRAIPGPPWSTVPLPTAASSASTFTPRPLPPPAAVTAAPVGATSVHHPGQG